MLFVANFNAGNNTVTVYAPPYTGTPTTINTGVNDPQALALDAAGDLFVANINVNTVTEYAPPYIGAPTIISTAVSGPDALALDVAGDLFVANDGNFPSPYNVTEYAPPYTSTPTIISSGVPKALALDAAGKLFVANANNTVTLYVPPYTGASPTTISTGVNGPENTVDVEQSRGNGI